jgi:outer membrane lipoprotein carrier protein
MTKTNRRFSFRALWLLAVGCVAALTSAAGLAESGDAAQYLREFESSYHSVRTLRAEFTQTYTSLGRTRVESGTMVLARGGKMRWNYRAPEQKLFISDGREMLLYVPEEKQLTRSSTRDTADLREPLSVLLSRVNWRKAFSKVELLPSTAAHDPADRVLQAYPRARFAEDYKSVVLEVTPSFDIRRLVITYPDESSMQFEFAQVERNVPVSPSMFEFLPPAGTEVIQQ